MVIPSTLAEYMLLVCERLKLSNATLHLVFSLTSRFLSRRPNALPLQLVGLASILIASKFIESKAVELADLHKWSCNSFTNKGNNLYK